MMLRELRHQGATDFSLGTQQKSTIIVSAICRCGIARALNVIES